MIGNGELTGGDWLNGAGEFGPTSELGIVLSGRVWLEFSRMLCSPPSGSLRPSIRSLAQMVLLCLGLVGCVSQARINQMDDEDDIREAVIHRLINEASSSIKPSAAAYFVAFGPRDDDPPMGFMARFQGNLPPVYRFSRCKVTAGKGVVDRISGEDGVLFSVLEIQWNGPDLATVSTAYYESMVNSGKFSYQVKKGDEGWKVVMPR